MAPLEPVTVVRPSSAKRMTAPPLVIPTRTVRATVEPTPEDPATHLGSFLRQHGLALLLATALGMALAFVYTRSVPPIFRAAALLEIQDVSEKFVNLRDVSPVSKDAPTNVSELPTQLRLLQSRTLLERVVAQVPPERIPPPAGVMKWLNRAPSAPTLLSRVESAAQNLQVRDSRGTRMVEVAFESPDANYAAAFVNQLAQQYISQSVESRLEISRGTSQWLERQMAELRGKLNVSETRLQQYARASGLVVLNAERRPDEEKLRQIQDSLSKAQENRSIRQARLETLLAAPLDSLDPPVGSPLRDHQTKLAELRRQRADLNTIYTPNFDGIKRLDAQINTLETAWRNEATALLQSVKNDYQDSVARERLLRDSYQEQVGEVTKQGEIAIQYDILKREVDTNRQLYNTLMQRAAEAKVASALRASSGRLVDPATVPYRRARPSLLLNLIWGATAGFLGGLVFVTVRNRADQRIHSTRDFVSAVPQLGVIPRFRPRLHAEAGLIRVDANPHGPAHLALTTWNHRVSREADAYRSVLTSILFSPAAGRVPQVIVVTSPQSGDGKTTLVTNLAAALAQMQRSVLLIDGSRERGLHEVFGLSDNYGLSDLMDLPEVNPSLLSYVTHATPIPGVSLVASGPREGSALDLLYAMSPLLSDLRRAYDVLLIDAPSIHELPDARVFGRLADGVILVVRAGETTRDAAQAAASRLQDDGTVLLGTVLNQSL
ncbi:MAG: polysaccharide biosynthesis tyrosine autokinase [Bryobacteraceae bacterium]|nr:polysaccharide biosynthesis tyrosine autokinase [Bryobacteraceae bacterium]